MISKFIIILFCVLPFANLYFSKVDMWHAQGFLFQTGLLVVYSWHIFQKNKPFGSLICWAGLLTAFHWIRVFEKTMTYAPIPFLPFFNLLCMVILYELMLKYFNKETLQKLLTYLTIPLGLILVYALLQKLQLDQFYRGLGGGNPKDEIIGTIGNPTLLSHYLCICMPCFFLLENKLKKLAILATLGIIALTGSASGLVIAIVILIVYSFFKRIFTWHETILLGILIVLACVFQYKDLHGIIHNFTFDEGRFKIWKDLYSIFKDFSITGKGLGIFTQIAKLKNFWGWRYAHNEFYHFSIELGFIGLGIIIWGIIDYFKTFWKIKKENLSVILASIFLAFILISLVGFPGHLWLTSSMSLISYAGIYLLKENYDFNIKGNQGQHS